MARHSDLQFDEIGYWSEVKLDIVRRYAQAYSAIFSAKRQARFHHIYIDAFAGAGWHISRTTGGLVPGSPLNALHVNPPFKEYYFIDLDGLKVDRLRRSVGERADVHILEGDCNQLLLCEVFPKVRFEQYRRALCLLDPYGLHLNWQVIEAAGRTKSVDMFLNFPVMDMNRNALWRYPERVAVTGVARMNAFWGDESWRTVAYRPEPTLFGDEHVRANIAVIAEAFGRRLREAAGFQHVPKPLPMRNSLGAIIYYLFFAAQNQAAVRIANYLLRKYETRGAPR